MIISSKVTFFHNFERSQKEPKIRKKPNEIFGSQTKSKEAKIEKFGSLRQTGNPGSKQCSSIISSPKLVVVHFNHATQVYRNDFACYLS